MKGKRCTFEWQGTHACNRTDDLVTLSSRNLTSGSGCHVIYASEGPWCIISHVKGFDKSGSFYVPLPQLLLFHRASSLVGMMS